MQCHHAVIFLAKLGILVLVAVCSVFLSTRRRTANAVSVLILLHRRDLQALWSQKYDTERLQRDAVRKGSTQCNATPGYWVR